MLLYIQVFISYIDVLSTPEQRRLDLKDNYYFLCLCSKCTNQKEKTRMNAAACPKSTCSACINMKLNNCPRCGTAILPKFRDNYNEVTALTITHLENMKDFCCKQITGHKTKLYLPIKTFYRLGCCENVSQ